MSYHNKKTCKNHKIQDILNLLTAISDAIYLLKRL